MKTTRMSFTVPMEVRRDLDYLSQRMGVSRSALLVQLIQQPVSDLRQLVRDVPKTPSKGDMKRLRGRSEEIIEKRFSDVAEIKVEKPDNKGAKNG